MRSRAIITAALVAAATLSMTLAGCGAGAGAAEPARLVLKDAEKRVAGDPCNGSGPYRDIHATATFTVRTLDGDVVAEGELPQGVADKTIDIDFDGIAEPTSCRFVFDAALPDSADRVLLDVGDRVGLVMMRDPDDDAWEAILP